MRIFRIVIFFYGLTQMPQLQEIDDIERSVKELESAAYMLDAYSQKLEAKYNALVRNKK